MKVVGRDAVAVVGHVEVEVRVGGLHVLLLDRQQERLLGLRCGRAGETLEARPEERRVGRVRQSEGAGLLELLVELLGALGAS